MGTKKDFWDEQAGKGELSGTRDRYAKEMEMQAIAKHVKDGMRVLDVGCGDGETLMRLRTQFAIEGEGLDSSKEMVAKAIRSLPHNSDILFVRDEIRNLNLITKEHYDLVYTQRALINLDTWEEQRQAILDILSLLKPGGTYVMVECFWEGLQEINELRLEVGLESIVPPWHNRYLKLEEIARITWPVEYDFQIEYFSGAYYFMSRVVNAWWHHQHGMEPFYGHWLNHLGTLLPPECVNLRGQTQAWIIKKKETA